MSTRPDYTPTLVDATKVLLRAWHQAAPHPKDRPRVTTIGGKARLYVPTETANAEKRLRATLSDAWAQPPTACRLHLEAVFVLPPPAKSGARLPDVDNLLKMVMDAANKVVYADDRQVEAVLARRRVRPRVEMGTLVLVCLAP